MAPRFYRLRGFLFPWYPSVVVRQRRIGLRADSRNSQRRRPIVDTLLGRRSCTTDNLPQQKSNLTPKRQHPPATALTPAKDHLTSAVAHRQRRHRTGNSIYPESRHSSLRVTRHIGERKTVIVLKESLIHCSFH